MMRRLAWLLLVTAAPLLADGGAILLHKQSPPFVVTVFASPAPPRVGPIDLSVLVQSSDTLEPVLDADVRFEFAGPDSQVQVQATRSQSGNKLLYAASVHLNDSGNRRYSVSIRAPKSQPITVSGDITVAAGQPKLEAYWDYLMLPFLGLAILALHQWLRLRKLAAGY